MEHSSIHLTISVTTFTWLDLVRLVLEQAASAPDLLRALPVGFAHVPSELDPSFTALLAEIGEGVGLTDTRSVLSRAAA